MSDELDKRVVRMEFDNSKFEKNVKQSQETLKKLDEQLEFKDGSKGIEKVEASLSHFQIVSFAVINRVTNKIIDLGVNFVKALSVDNISAGWTKFGQKTTSVATLAAQKIKIAGKEIEDAGEKMKVINDQLDKLNFFSDETSYNFTDMIDNIGKFTAAGRSLDESVNAMMGIANWAALSGQNASVASRAMYQLSQALGKGYVQLIDWRSIGTANMDTQEFRETVLQTAVDIGELTKAGNEFITKTGKKFTLEQFTESLSSKWFTNDVLLKTLSKYSSAVQDVYEIASKEGISATEVLEKYGDQFDKFGIKAFKAAQEARTFTDVINATKDAVSTGWMTTAEQIFGGYEDAKNLWTELANELYGIFAEGGNFRNEVLNLWNTLEGRKDIFGEHGSSNQGAFWNIYDAIIAIKDLIKDAWSGVFNSSDFTSETERAQDLASKLKEITSQIREITSRVLNNIRNNIELKAVLSGLANTVGILVSLLKAAYFAISPIVYAAKDLAKYLFNRIAAFGLNMKKVQSVTENINRVASKLYYSISNIIEYINPTGILDSVIDTLSGILQELSKFDIINAIADWVKDFIDAMKSAGGNSESVQNILGGLASIIRVIGKLVIEVTKIISKYVLPIASIIIDTVSKVAGFLSGLLVTILGFVGDFITQLSNLILGKSSEFGELGNDIKNFVTDMLARLKKLSPVLKSIVSITKTFVDLILLLPKAIDKLFVNFTGKTFGENIVAFFDNLAKSISNLYNKIQNGIGGKGSNNLFDPIINLANGIKSFLKGLWSILSGIISLTGTIIGAVGKILSGIGSVLQDISKFANGVELKQTTKALLTIVTILATITAIGWIIYSLFYGIKSLLAPVQYVMENVGDTIYNLGKAMKNKSIADIINSIGEFLKSIAFLMLSLSASIAVIAAIPENGFIRGVVTIGVFSVIISALAITLTVLSAKLKTLQLAQKTLVKTAKTFTGHSATQSYTTMSEVARVLMSIGLAIVEFAIAVKIIASLNINESWSAAGMLTLFMIAISVIAIELVKHAPKEKDAKALAKNTSVLKKMIKLIGTMAFSLMIISKSIAKLASVDTTKMWNAFAAMGLTIVLISAFVIELAKVSKTKKGESTANFKGVASIFLAISVLALSILKFVKNVSGMDEGKLWYGIGVLSAILTILAVFVGLIELVTVLTSKLNKKGSKLEGLVTVTYTQYDGIAAMFASMSVLLLSISSTLSILSNIGDHAKLWSSVGAISTLLIAFAAMIAIISKFSTAQKTLEQSLDKTKSNKLGKKFKGAFNKSTNGTDWSGVTGFILGMSSALLIISGALSKMDKLDPDKMKSSVLAIIVLMGAFVVAIKSMVNVSDKSKNFKAKELNKLMIVMSIVLWSIAGVISVLGKMDIATVWSSVGAIVLILDTLAVVISIISKFGTSGKKAEANMAQLVILTFSMVMFVNALSTLKDVPWQTILAASGGLIAVLMAIAGVITIISKFGTSGKKAEANMAQLAILTGTMTLFMLSLSTLKDIPWQTILAASGGLIAVLMAITGVIAIISKFGTSGKKAKSNMAQLAILTGTMTLFMLSLSTLKDIPWQTILAAAGAVSVVLYALVGAVALMSMIKVEPTSMLAFAAAILVLSASLIPFAVAMQLLQIVGWSSIGKGAIILAGGLTLLVAAAKIMGPAVVNLLAVSAAVIMLGAGLLMASMALTGFAANLGISMEEIVANSELIGTALQNIGPMLVDALFSGFIELFSKLGELIPKIENIVIELINSLVNIFSNEATLKLPESIMTLVDSCIEALNNRIPKILESVKNIAKTILQWLKDNIVWIANDTITVLLKIIDTITSRMDEITTSLVNFLTKLTKDLFDKIWPVIKLIVDKIIEILPELFKQLLNLVTVVSKFVLVFIGYVIKMVIASLGTLAKLMFDLLAGIILLVVEVFKGLTRVIFAALRYMAYTVVDLIGDVLEALLKDIPTFVKSIGGKIIAAVLSTLSDMVRDIPILKVLSGPLDDAAKNLSNNARLNTEGILQNVYDELDSARRGISGVVTNITSRVGEDVTQGISDINAAMASSMEELTGTAKKGGENAGNATSEGYRDALEIHSPSKVFARLGGYVVDGLTNGLNDNTGAIRNSAISMMNDTVTAAKSVIDNANMDDDIVIRPVMDLSNIQSGVSNISSLMSNVNGTEVSMSGRLASSITKDNKRASKHASENKNGTIINNGGDTYNPTFNITSNDPEAVAREVDIRMQRMRMQSSLAKGGAR